MRGVRTFVPLAAEVGKGLERSEVLLGTLPAPSTRYQAALIARAREAEAPLIAENEAKRSADRGCDHRQPGPPAATIIGWCARMVSAIAWPERNAASMFAPRHQSPQAPIPRSSSNKHGIPSGVATRA